MSTKWWDDYSASSPCSDDVDVLLDSEVLDQLMESDAPFIPLKNREKSPLCVDLYSSSEMEFNPNAWLDQSGFPTLLEGDYTYEVSEVPIDVEPTTPEHTNPMDELVVPETPEELQGGGKSIRKSKKKKKMKTKFEPEQKLRYHSTFGYLDDFKWSWYSTFWPQFFPSADAR